MSSKSSPPVTLKRSQAPYHLVVPREPPGSPEPLPKLWEPPTTLTGQRRGNETPPRRCCHGAALWGPDGDRDRLSLSPPCTPWPPLPATTCGTHACLCHMQPTPPPSVPKVAPRGTQDGTPYIRRGTPSVLSPGYHSGHPWVAPSKW